MEPPKVTVGNPAEYRYWEARVRRFLEGRRKSTIVLERVDARYNYRENRITLYHLADPSDERSVADTLSHEYLHALLYQIGEEWAAHAIDLIGKPVGNPARAGGI